MLKSLIILLQSTTAHAQAAGAPAQNPMLQFLPLVVVFVIFYFLMIRPQKKKFEEEQLLLNKLAKGDEGGKYNHLADVLQLCGNASKPTRVKPHTGYRGRGR